jgi:ATP-dependent DNA helicase RecG
MEVNSLLDVILDIPTETQTIEFKRLGKVNNGVERIIESVIAMTNAEGGTIILGVDDPEKTRGKGADRFFGIEENIDLYDALGRELQKIVPPLGHVWPPQLISTPNGKRIALITVPKSVDHFHSCNNHVWVREERSNRLLSPQEIIKFAYAKGFEKADRELVNVDISLLDTDLFAGWKRTRKLKGGDLEETLHSTGLAREDKGKLLPTRAAVLLFADHPTDLMETKCAIRIFQYTGTIESINETINLIGTPTTIEGPIVQQIAEAHEYILGILRTGIRVPSGFVTQYQLPERAVKEAITNAVIHRDYHIKRDIEIRVFEDRIEIESPGLFPYNITRANIGKVRSDGYRNDLLVKHLRDFPSPPNLDQNEGVRAMRSAMKTTNLYPPIFFSYPNLQDAVRVVLLNEKIASEWEKVNSYLQSNKYISNQDARRITGIVQRDKMARILKGWVLQGVLIQMKPKSGYVKNTKYRLPEIIELQK